MQETDPINNNEQSVNNSIDPGLNVNQGDNKPPKPTRNWFSIPLVLVLVLGIVVVAYFMLHANNRPTPKPQVSNPNAYSQRTAQDYLLQRSQTIQGVSIGYLKVNKPVSRGNLFMGRVYADTPEYEPAVFFKRSDNQLYALNTITRETRQLTKQGGNNPVFSSINQQLAYNSEPCSISAINVTDNSVALLKQGANYTNPEDTASVCYRPNSWSPDGKKLALFGLSLADPKLGLVTLSKLNIYDVDSKITQSIDAPQGFNTVYGDVRWFDNENLIINYAEFGQFASLLKQQAYKLNISTKDTSKLGDNYKFDFGTAQVVGNTIFAHTPYGGSDQFLVFGPAEGGDIKKIEGSDNAGTFLIKTNEDASKATDMYLLNGNAGSENSFKLLRLPASGGQAKELFAPKGFSAYMLGWGQDFDQIIYMAGLSGKSEIQQYTISTQKMDVLVPDLPLQ